MIVINDSTEIFRKECYNELRFLIRTYMFFNFVEQKKINQNVKFKSKRKSFKFSLQNEINFPIAKQ